MTRDTRWMLCRGEEAWCLLSETEGTRSKSGKRSTLLGAALVRVDGIEPYGYDVTVLGASPRWYEGRQITKPRIELYARLSRAERREFAALIQRFWPKAAERVAETARQARRSA